jgi:hypothetical protein
MVNHIPQLRTPGVIADELGEPLTRVLYVLRNRDIKPIGRAGTLRLYDHEAVVLVRSELDAINSRRRQEEEANVSSR